MRIVEVKAGQRFALVPGHCGSCDRKYKEGEWIWTDERGRDLAAFCCPEIPPEFALPGTEWESPIAQEETVALALVLPRGRSAADKCPHCFMIPSSNGACGCY